MVDMFTSDYDGCGKCWVGSVRLSRKTDTTHSPERQRGQILGAAADCGGHIIAWSDDLEVSGATDPLTRKGLGPWLRGEMGPYDGVVAASVDRVGRNVRDTLNTQDMLTKQDLVIVTADHSGVWDFTDPAQENEWMIKAWGSQMELRNIQKRNRDETARARAAGQPKQKPSYGYMYVRLFPNGPIDHVAYDPIASEIIWNVKRRILADRTGKITKATEAARLTREGVPSPDDRRAQLYGRPMKGSPWTAKTVGVILTSEAALGYLMHQGRPVLDKDGRPVRIAPPLWDQATRDALIEATTPKRAGSRAPKGVNRCSGLSFCGNCQARLYIAGRSGPEMAYGCTARVRGIITSQACKPAPSIKISILDGEVETWFLGTYGTHEVMERIYDPGTGYAERIAALQADKARLRSDRLAGLYDDPEEDVWFKTNYARLNQEIEELRKLPERPAGMRTVSTGITISQKWAAAHDDAERREMLDEYGVRVTLFPETAPQRFTITGTVFALSQSA
ncbi:recombinase family protein [Streptacidiphilus sp. N1-10]|uniref:Recombinase family protein n=1 Tax=Streptacidiphilus jeojiensis TaxID=3229225 RepID=A0ABV6XNE8_9ACTN